MRKILLLALLFSSRFTSAQTAIPDDQCKAAFKYEINDQLMSPVAATAIHFYDRSAGDIINWFWDFGDGITSTEQHPTFMFPHPVGGPTVKISPYKTVSLTVLTADSCKSMYSESINIMEGITYPVNACYAGFKYYQTNYDSIAKTVTFQLTNGSAGDSLQYEWNFGEGKTSTEKEPTVTFDLSQNERKVCLTIRGSNDCSSEFCDALYIYNPDQPVDHVDPMHCETVFGYSVNYDYQTFAPALTLDFYSKAYPEPVKWSWDFGDGTTSEEANPTHSFNYPLGRDSILEITTPFRTVCLKVETVTGCVASYCQTINIYMDSNPVDKVPSDVYTMRYESSFPPYMSSCAGWAKAQVYMNDSPVKADNYLWSNGAEGQEVKGLCPTQMYTVKAITADGIYVSGTFLFNSDGTVTDATFNWWVTGMEDNEFIRYDLANKDYTVEWRLCNGEIVQSDSIPLNLMNCESNESNMIVKDASGEVVYSENISMKALTTGIKPAKTNPSVKLFPNPVSDVLNIQYAGQLLDEMQLEICNMTGRSISLQKFYNIQSGQQISLNMSSLPKGIYLCKILSGKQVLRIEKFSK